MKQNKMLGGNFLPRCSDNHIDISNHHTVRNYLDYYPAMTGGSNFLPKCSNNHIDISNHHPIRNYLDYYPAMTGGYDNHIENHPGIGNHQNLNNSPAININNYARVNSLNTNNVLAKLIGGKRTKKNTRKRKSGKSKRGGVRKTKCGISQRRNTNHGRTHKSSCLQLRIKTSRSHQTI